MTTCTRCQVSVSADHLNCPLCHNHLSDTAVPTISAYPSYTPLKVNKRFHIKVWLYISLIVCTLSFALNILTWSRFPVTWAPTVSIASLYLWYVGKDLYLAFSINMIAKTLWKNYIFLALVLIILDLSFGFDRWSLNYVIPFLGIGTAFAMTISSVKNKSMWRDDIGYILLTVSLNIIPLLLFFAKGSNVLWPSIASLLYGGLTILGLFIFSGKRLLYELQKRFHF